MRKAVVVALACLSCGGTNEERRWTDARDRYCHQVDRTRSEMNFAFAALGAGLSGVRAGFAVVASRPSLAERDAGSAEPRLDPVAGACENYGFALGRAMALSDGHAAVLQATARAAPARAGSSLFSLEVPRLADAYKDAIGICAAAAMTNQRLKEGVVRTDELEKLVPAWRASYESSLGKLEAGCKESGFATPARP